MILQKPFPFPYSWKKVISIAHILRKSVSFCVMFVISEPLRLPEELKQERLIITTSTKPLTTDFAISFDFKLSDLQYSLAKSGVQCTFTSLGQFNWVFVLLLWLHNKSKSRNPSMILQCCICLNRKKLSSVHTSDDIKWWKFTTDIKRGKRKSVSRMCGYLFEIYIYIYIPILLFPFFKKNLPC